ncbi:hypothetical protein DEALK_17350 [Dehalogenimonas alkenigignens]|uniref:Uncharacterized protein n=1 Tax=Dehalogenimonas alkenigignens TaxID=1217799 RepID=A0A0W0GK16_9CHLR|nr:hypothetical protein DEALK_17350 [Dehalogenimonas alkenigignens]
MKTVQPSITSDLNSNTPIEVEGPEKPFVMRLPFAYTSLDEACIMQADRIWTTKCSHKSVSNYYSLSFNRGL